MTPTSRQELKEFCLRKLGWPVIQIEMDDDQIEDRIDEALKYFADYSFDGAEKTYYKHVITDEDKANGYIIMPENIMGVVKIFNIGSRMTSINNLFGIQYQMALNELYTFSTYSMIPYYMGMMHLSLIDQLLVGEKPIRYSRHRNQLHLDFDLSYIETGQYLLVEAWEVIDPEEFPDVYGDRWLAKYATAKIKQNWGAILKKYQGMAMPSGITFNGQQIYDEATEEIAELEKEMLDGYSTLPPMKIG
jgi:hypothetical protein